MKRKGMLMVMGMLSALFAVPAVEAGSETRIGTVFATETGSGISIGGRSVEVDRGSAYRLLKGVEPRCLEDEEATIQVFPGPPRVLALTGYGFQPGDRLVLYQRGVKVRGGELTFVSSSRLTLDLKKQPPPAHGEYQIGVVGKDFQWSNSLTLVVRPAGGCRPIDPPNPPGPAPKK